MEKDEEKSSVFIHGDKESVWQALTDGTKLTKWFAPGCPWEIPHLKAGEKAIFTLKPNKHNHLREDFPLFLTIKSVIPYEEFSFTVDLDEAFLAFEMKEEDDPLK